MACDCAAGPDCCRGATRREPEGRAIALCKAVERTARQPGRCANAGATFSAVLGLHRGPVRSGVIYGIARGEGDQRPTNDLASGLSSVGNVGAGLDGDDFGSGLALGQGRRRSENGERRDRNAVSHMVTRLGAMRLSLRLHVTSASKMGYSPRQRQDRSIKATELVVLVGYSFSELDPDRPALWRSPPAQTRQPFPLAGGDPT